MRARQLGRGAEDRSWDLGRRAGPEDHSSRAPLIPNARRAAKANPGRELSAAPAGRRSNVVQKA